MDFKFLCACGTKYAFEAEPAGGRMPWAVVCPSCGVDATEHANSVIQQRIGASSSGLPTPGIGLTAPRAEVIAPAVPAPTAPQVAPGVSLPPPVPVGAPRLRLGLTAHSTPRAPEPEPAAGDVAASSAPVSHGPTARQPRIPPSASLPREQSFGLGVTGAIIGGVLGVIAWFIIFKTTGLRLKWLGVGVGYLTGMSAKFLGGRVGSRNLGIAAGSCALLFILLASLLIAKSRVTVSEEDVVKNAYSEFDNDLKNAQETLKQMPNQSDAEIRYYLAKQYVKKGERPDPTSVSTEELDDFKRNELQRTRDLVNGKITKANYRADAKKNLEEYEESAGSSLAMMLSVSLLLSIGMIVAGVGTAYKVACE